LMGDEMKKGHSGMSDLLIIAEHLKFSGFGN